MFYEELKEMPDMRCKRMLVLQRASECYVV